MRASPYRFLLTAMLTGACGPSSALHGSVPNPERRELAELVLLEAPGDSSAGALMQAAGPSVHDVVSRIEALRTDPRTVALFVRLGPMGGAWGRIADVHDALQAVRDAGKPVHCHLESIDNAGYWLAATSCDRISVTPAGMLDTVGVAAQVFYARGLLDQVGLRAELLQVGAFKGAAEPFTRDAMSPEMRASLGGVLDGLQAELVGALVEGRHLSPERAQEVLDAGPHDGAQALELGLVDAVEFDDEARSHAREAGRATRHVRARLLPPSEPTTLADLIGALAADAPTDDAPQGAHLALVHLDGEISDGEEAGMGSGRGGPFVTRMRALAEDDEVRAVVLRINSPGGSALASDRMWHAVRRVAARKPVIVSVGDMAASGGYYIASAGTEILAQPGSIVGSIGVVGGKVEASGLLERAGVHAETLTRGAHAGWTAPTAPFGDAERAVLQAMMERTYRRFVHRVAVGRGLDEARVQASAEGRIWTGRTGVERGLVNGLGGLRDALAHARTAGHLDPDAPVVEWPRRRTLVETVVETMGAQDGAEVTAGALATAGLGPAAAPLQWLRMLRGGEHVLVALPVALDVR